MLENEMKNILRFFNFTDQLIVDVDYLINQSKKLDIHEAVHSHLSQFDPSPSESYPIFYKKVFFSEITWRLVELVCAEKYPEVAIGNLEDFCLYFHDIWISNDETNPFYRWLSKVDMREMSVKEIVDKHFSDLNHIYIEYFEDGRETLLEKGLI